MIDNSMLYLFEPWVKRPVLSKLDENAGYDLFGYNDEKTRVAIVLAPFEIYHVRTGLHVRIPDGYVGLVKERSSYPYNHVPLRVCGGVIDSGYQGEIRVFLQNVSAEPLLMKFDKAIAQLVVHRLYKHQAMVASKEFFAEAFDGTVRGSGMAGSTGV
jgi:dUTP pyrophosphatase